MNTPNYAAMSKVNEIIERDKPTYIIEAGSIVTTYKAYSSNEALELYARDAGYSNYYELVQEHGQVDAIY